MKTTSVLSGIALLLAGGLAVAQGRGGQAPSPAAQRPPQTTTPQTYPAEQVRAGQTRFASQCGFCHGRDAGGSDTGPDLTRSTLVAGDVRGDKIGPVIRSGRLDKGMPAFDMNDSEIGTIVAFIHDQKSQADLATGGRRSVDATDLETGDAAAGRRYFDAACTRCHSATGDLAGVAARHQGLTLLQRMLSPSTTGRSNSGARVPQTVTVTLPAGQLSTGRLADRDECTIALTACRNKQKWQGSIDCLQALPIHAVIICTRV
jgi:cytochrome c oxidase cbb3-type subunit 3